MLRWSAWLPVLRRMAKKLQSSPLTLQECKLRPKHPMLITEMQMHKDQMGLTDEQAAGHGWETSYRSHLAIRRGFAQRGTPAPRVVSEHVRQ